MAIVLMTPPYVAFYDDNGNPLSGGKVYTYQAGTSTPKATYTDQGGLTANSNPVILDSAGRANIWLDNASGYKFTVSTSADVVIRTVDNVTGFNTSGGLAVLGTIASNTLVGNNTGASATPTALTVAQVTAMLGLASPQSHIAGYTISSISGTNTTASLTISAGQATDSTAAQFISKATTTSWAVSNGNAANGYQGGTTLPNSDTIHLFMISGTSGTACFAHNGLTPTLPSGYTYYRRIGSFNTTGAGAPIPYITFEGAGGALLCHQTVPTSQTLSVTTSDALYTINYLPTDIRVRPIWSTSMATSSALAFIYPDGVTSAAPAVNGTAPGNNTNNNGGQVANNPELITNTSAQVRIRASTSDSLYVYGYGWEDFRR